MQYPGDKHMTMYSTAEARLGVFLIEIFALYDRLHPHKRFTRLEVWFLVSTLTLIRQNNDYVVFVIREGRGFDRACVQVLVQNLQL